MSSTPSAGGTSGENNNNNNDDGSHKKNWHRLSCRVPDLTAPPTNPLVTALLTDLYQLTMAYAHYKNNKHEEPAVFELFFRKNPFGGEYTVLAGLDECLRHLKHFGFEPSDVEYLKTLPAFEHCDPSFFEWLLSIDCSRDVKVYAMKDGTVAFPRVPLMVVEAPLAIGQLLETTLLTLVNYPSLLATNAARMVRAAENKNTRRTSLLNNGGGDNDGTTIVPLPKQCTKVPVCIEFGLRRAQGPDGGFSASKYAKIGGFAATSNVQAGKLCGLTLAGTHAHAFVQAYSNLDEVRHLTVKDKNGNGDDVKLLPRVLEYRSQFAERYSPDQYGTTNEGELAAFVAYAAAFPDRCLCLIDTYDTLQSGLLNFVLVAMALDDYGYKPSGIRLDSGDLAYLSMECAKAFAKLASSERRDFFHDLSIVVSNDINEAVLHAINKEEHAITTYGIGTNLVTCQSQPALGCVYKLVEISGIPRMKLSQEIEKVLIPGKKHPFRLYGKDGRPILDVMVSKSEESIPTPHVRMMCRHPFIARKRVAVTPHRVEPLHTLVFDEGNILAGANRTLDEAKDAVANELGLIRPDILRYINPTPYKVSLSSQLFDFLHDLWQSEIPVPELS